MAESEVTSQSNTTMTESNQSNHLEHNTVVITNQKLNSHNYLSWSRSVELFVTGRGKEDYIYGRIVTPATSDPNYRAWKSEIRW